MGFMRWKGLVNGEGGLGWGIGDEIMVVGNDGFRQEFRSGIWNVISHSTFCAGIFEAGFLQEQRPASATISMQQYVGSQMNVDAVDIKIEKTDMSGYGTKRRIYKAAVI